MDELQLIIILVVVTLIILVSSIIYSHKNKQVIGAKLVRVGENQPNRRKNFRIRVNIRESLMEVKKIGDNEINEHDFCEIVDISAGGVGILCEYDFPLRQNVSIKIHFTLNNINFSLDGKIVRKIEKMDKRSVFYGVAFTDLSMNEENSLIKEIVAIENQRRKIAIK